MTINQLIQQLVTDGGAIVSSGDCSEMEITNAQATGRFSVREDGMGFVLRSKEWLALQLAREKAHPEALTLLEEAEDMFAGDENVPNETWCRRLYAITGEHMVLTDEGWEPAEVFDPAALPDIKDEVNAPDGKALKP